MTGVGSVEIQLAISRVAMGVLTEPYRGERNTLFEPQRRTVVHDAWHGERLSERHQVAWRMTVNLFLEAGGRSAKGSSYGEATGGTGDGQPLPTAYVNVAYQKLERLRDQHLHNHEWRLLHALMMETLQNVKLHSLEQMGKIMSGYGDKAQARASGVTSLQRLFDSLAEFHGI